MNPKKLSVMYEQLEEWLKTEITWAGSEGKYLRVKQILAAIRLMDDLFNLLRSFCDGHEEKDSETDKTAS